MEDLVHAIKFPNEIDPFDQRADEDHMEQTAQIMSEATLKVDDEEESMSDLRAEGIRHKIERGQEQKLEKQFQDEVVAPTMKTQPNYDRDEVQVDNVERIDLRMK